MAERIDPGLDGFGGAYNDTDKAGPRKAQSHKETDRAQRMHGSWTKNRRYTTKGSDAHRVTVIAERQRHRKSAATATVGEASASSAVLAQEWADKLDQQLTSTVKRQVVVVADSPGYHEQVAGAGALAAKNIVQQALQGAMPILINAILKWLKRR